MIDDIDPEDAVKQLLTDDELNQNFEEVLEHVRRTVIGRDAYVPELHIITKNFEEYQEDKFSRTVVVFATFPDTFKERCDMMFEVGTKAAENKTEAGFTNFPFEIVFISEVYIKEGLKELPEGKRVQDMPGRKEGIMVTAMSMDNRLAIATYEVIKDEGGKFKELKEIMYKPYEDNGKEDKSSAFVLVPFWQGFSTAILPGEMRKNE